MTHSDTETIQAVLGGDVDRYAELVDRYQGPTYRLALSLLGNSEDAKDVSQEAFVNAYCSLRRFRGGARFSTWLFRIVVNECKDVYRRRARQPVATMTVGEPEASSDGSTLFVDVPDSSAGPGEQVASREVSQRISQGVAQLPLKQRTAFALRHLHGLSLDEVAAVMRCRIGTVKSHLFRATASLRTQLEPWLARG